MSKDRPYPYTIRFSEAERKEYDVLAEKYGFTTLSKLIRRALAVVQANPILLSEFPEIEGSYEIAFKLLDGAKQQFEAQKKQIEQEARWKQSIDAKIDWIIQKLVTSKQNKGEMKQLIDDSGEMEAIFDE
ncbi:MAG: hypothetical protein ACXACI_01965 [Candidatus Hodarchaeales archaeon]|jgi:hypothetical protein